MPSEKEHIAELDGLRGIAILLICVFHFSFVLSSSSSPSAHKLQNVLWLGWTGVDLFFALSGFLITGILLDSLDSTSYFRTFYIRRALRIFPLYFAFLAVMLGLMHHLLWRHKYPGIATWWYLSYLQNWKPNHTAGDLHVDHLWSLAVEEQFYMAWPLLIWLAPTKYLAHLTLVFAAAAMMLRAFVVPANGYEFMYRGTLTRMDGLALGAFIAVALRAPRLRAILHRLLPFVLPAALAIVGSAFAVQGNFQWNRPMQLYGATGLAAFFCLLVFWCVDSRPAWMRNGFLRSFARYSYAIYVFHSPLNQILIASLDPVWRRFPPALDLFLRCLYIFAMTAVAWGLARFSWIYFEEPINRLKVRFPYRKGPLRSIVSASR